MLPSVKSDAFVAGVSEPNSGVVKVEEREFNEKVEKMRASIASLKNKYPDIYGWIYVEDTNIDYPIVRGKDNEFYLDHAFTGEPMAVGSIFADFRINDYILDNYNTVLYGHNSSTGKMFAQVMKLAQDEELFNTAKIYIYTPTGLYIFEPFCLAILDASSYYYRTKFSTPEAFVAFAKICRKINVRKENHFTADDRILTLQPDETGIKHLIRLQAGCRNYRMTTKTHIYWTSFSLPHLNLRCCEGELCAAREGTAMIVYFRYVNLCTR